MMNSSASSSNDKSKTVHCSYVRKLMATREAEKVSASLADIVAVNSSVTMPSLPKKREESVPSPTLGSMPAVGNNSSSSSNSNSSSSSSHVNTIHYLSEESSSSEECETITRNSDIESLEGLYDIVTDDDNLAISREVFEVHLNELESTGYITTSYLESEDKMLYKARAGLKWVEVKDLTCPIKKAILIQLIQNPKSFFILFNTQKGKAVLSASKIEEWDSIPTQKTVALILVSNDTTLADQTPSVSNSSSSNSSSSTSTVNVQEKILRNFTICTEENPQINEVEFILKYLGVPSKVTRLTSSFTNKKWNGSFIAETDTPSIYVIVLLVKGSGSFVDYVVYDHLSPDEKTSIPILLMESTKTSDSESRNTAINQRFTKFAVAGKRFQNTPMVMYYNTKQTTTTPTSLFGRRLLATRGVKIYDLTYKDMLVDAPPFTRIEDIIEEKNRFKEKKGNVSVKISIVAPHRYEISAKLAKGTNTTICHDPNKGLITGIASSIYRLDKDAKFTITQHGVNVEKLKTASEKFWYANSEYDMTIEGCPLTSLGSICPDQYWKLDTQSEKAATINYQNYMEMNGWATVYHNHSSSARSYFVDLKGVEHQIPKNLTIPDVVMVQTHDKRIQICEGKIMKDCLMGVKQLDNLTMFIEYLDTHYKGYTVERGLCLYAHTLSEVESIKSTLPYKVFFALDSSGTIYT